MLLEELFRLTNWVLEHVAAPNIENTYQELHNVLQRNSQQQDQQPFENEKAALLEVLNAVPLEQLTTSQLHTLETLELAPHIGPHGADRVEEILVTHPVDIATAAQRIKESINSVNQAVSWCKEVNQRLTRIVDEEAREFDPDTTLLRVHFANKSSISNVREFKDQGHNWYLIGNAIAKAHGKTPQDIRISSAARGSIIVDIIASNEIAITFGALIMWILSAIHKIEQIKAERERARNFRIQNQISSERMKKIEKEYDEEIKEGIDQAKADIRDKISKKLGLDNMDDQSVKSEVEKAVDRLVDFIHRGGDIEVIPPEEPDDSEEETESSDDESRERRAAIRTASQDIQRIRHETIHRLESDASNDDDAAEGTTDD